MTSISGPENDFNFKKIKNFSKKIIFLMISLFYLNSNEYFLLYPKNRKHPIPFS